MAGLGKLLFLAGVVLVILGALMMSGVRIPFAGFLGRLPGDIRIERPGFSLYFPLATSLLVSVVLTIVLRLFFRR